MAHDFRPAESFQATPFGPLACSLMPKSHTALEDLSVRSLLDALPECIALMDCDGTCLYANRSAYRLLGNTCLGAIQEAFYPLWQQAKTQDQTALICPLLQAQQGSIQISLEEGQPLWLTYSLMANVWPQVHLVLLYPSLTQGKNLTPPEADLSPSAGSDLLVCHPVLHTQTSLNLQTAALNACADVIMITDRTGAIEWVNPAFTTLTGYTPSEAIGKNPRDLVNSGLQDKDFFKTLWETILSGQVWRGELVNRRKDGSLYAEEMTITPVYDETSTISHFIAIKQDITLRKHSEALQKELTQRINIYARALERTNEALRLSEERYRSLIENQPDLICRFRPDGVLTFVNSAYCTVFGKTIPELLGTSILDYVPDSARAEVERQLVELQQLTPTSPTITHEHEVCLPDGSIRWHQWVNRALFDDQGQLVEYQATGRDVTLRVEAEAALRDRERLLNLFFSQSLDGFFFMMLDQPITWDDTVDKEAVLDYVFNHQRVTKVNQAMLNQYGLTEEDFLGLTPADLFAHDLEAGRVVWRQLFDLGRLYVNTWERRADGQPLWIEGDYTCLYDGQGRITGHFGIQRDVTDLQAAISKLQASEAKYRLLVENQTDLVVRIDATGVFQFVSPSYCDFFGITSEELIGSHFMALVHEDDRASTESAMAQLWHPPYACTVEQRVLTRYGWRWLSWSDKAILNEAGEVVSIVGVGRDITERKQVEDALQRSEARFRTVLENLSLVAITLDRQGNLVFCNDFFLELTGWQREEVLGQPWRDRFLPADLHQDIHQQFFQTREDQAFSVYYENEILTRTGDRRLIAWNNTLQRDDQGHILSITCIGEDITERKQYEADLFALTQRLTLATDAAQMGIWDWNLKTGKLVWDDRMFALYGVEPDTFGGTLADWEALVHPDDLPRVLQELEQMLSISTPSDPQYFHSEFQVVCPDGTRRYLEAHGLPTYDSAGQVERMTGVNWDISERKRSEHALADAHQQMQALMQNSPAIIELFDETGRYQQVNPITSAFLGLPEAEIVGRRFEEIHSHETTLLFMERIRQLVSTNRPFIVEDRLMLMGEERVLRSVLFPVLNKPGHPRLFGLIATDITGIIQAQARLLKQAEQERLIREMTTNIRRSLDLDTILESSVHEVRRLLGTDRVLIYRFNPDWSGDITVESVASPWIEILGQTIRDPCFAGELVEKFHHGYITQINDIQTAPIQACHRDLLSQFQVQANLVLPLVVDDVLWGLLCIHHCQAPRQWQAEEISFVQQITEQIEIAIQQAQWLQDSTLRAQREHLLNQIVTFIRESLDLSDILQRTTQKILETFQASQSTVVLCTDTDDSFEYTVCATVPGIRSLQGVRVPIRGNPYAQQVLTSEVPIAVPDVTLEPSLAPTLAIVQRLEIGSMLTVSIRYQGMVKGILCCYCPQPRQWTADEQLMIKQVADQLAIAIQQAELYQKAQAEIAQRIRLEEQLRHDAFHDALTGLPNRALFLDRLQFAMQRYQRWHRHGQHHQEAVTASNRRYQFAVLFLDLDRFKIINDSLGHEFGDKLLKLVATRLANCLREVDTAARLGGDEFVVLLEELSDHQFAIEIARRIHTVLEIPIFLEGHEVFIQASIGIAFSGPNYAEPSELLRDADIAMYQAKRNHEEYVVFDDSMHRITLQQLNLENDLRHAINRNEFRLYYQPIIHLETGEISGFEALVRWQHPTHGLLYPDAFIDLAEDTGLIAAIDLWVLHEACRQLQEWRKRFPQLETLSMSVNLSGKQFSQPDLIHQIDYVLNHTRLDGQYLKVEITEGVLIKKNTLVVDTLHALRSRHIQICMDDFGTGYSSLSYLHRFPVDIIKIDKSFILNLYSDHTNDRDYEIVKAIVNLALNLKLQVIAEGIENAETRAYLQANGCQFGQGYLFHPALSPEAVTDLLTQYCSDTPTPN